MTYKRDLKRVKIVDCVCRSRQSICSNQIPRRITIALFQSLHTLASIIMQVNSKSARTTSISIKAVSQSDKNKNGERKKGRDAMQVVLLLTKFFWWGGGGGWRTGAGRAGVKLLLLLSQGRSLAKACFYYYYYIARLEEVAWRFPPLVATYYKFDMVYCRKRNALA